MTLTLLALGSSRCDLCEFYLSSWHTIASVADGYLGWLWTLFVKPSANCCQDLDPWFFCKSFKMSWLNLYFSRLFKATNVIILQASLGNYEQNCGSPSRSRACPFCMKKLTKMLWYDLESTISWAGHFGARATWSPVFKNMNGRLIIFGYIFSGW